MMKTPGKNYVRMCYGGMDVAAGLAVSFPSWRDDYSCRVVSALLFTFPSASDDYVCL